MAGYKFEEDDAPSPGPRFTILPRADTRAMLSQLERGR